jgi:hypothetical protein
VPQAEGVEPQQKNTLSFLGEGQTDRLDHYPNQGEVSGHADYYVNQGEVKRTDLIITPIRERSADTPITAILNIYPLFNDY